MHNNNENWNSTSHNSEECLVLATQEPMWRQMEERSWGACRAAGCAHLQGRNPLVRGTQRSTSHTGLVTQDCFLGGGIGRGPGFLRGGHGASGRGSCDGWHPATGGIPQSPCVSRWRCATRGGGTHARPPPTFISPCPRTGIRLTLGHTRT